jgi:UDP-N-acetylglucosamine 4,6-dehydratase
MLIRIVEQKLSPYFVFIIYLVKYYYSIRCIRLKLELYKQNIYVFIKEIKMFKDKILLITGGTGSFGNAVLDRFLLSDVKEIRVLSRDEKKQEDMRKKYNNDKLKFYIGDVRDYRSIEGAFIGVDYVFHAAALKQVPSCEFYPLEAVKTNIIGSDNVISACVKNGVKKAIFLSTDKAAYPINAMGMSKALMEKNVVARSRQLRPTDTVLCLTRYGNVMASRGSVIPLFIDQIAAAKPITITNPDMTRFMMTLEDAVDLVLYAFENGQQGDLFVQKAPAATIDTLAKAILELKGVNQKPVSIGTRHGEKLYEVLVTQEEMVKAIDLPGFFRIPADNRNLNYDKFVEKGLKEFAHREAYHSHNTERLDVEGMKKLLLKLDLFK